MKHSILRRALSFLLVLLGVSILSFALIGLFGRDPAEIIAFLDGKPIAVSLARRSE